MGGLICFVGLLEEVKIWALEVAGWGAPASIGLTWQCPKQTEEILLVTQDQRLRHWGRMISLLITRMLQ